ncbi:unnamed protein product [Closterium sp. Naga37s-1]|nr:unnamed protein product [Closterium sp. Naga37s-1]
MRRLLLMSPQGKGKAKGKMGGVDGGTRVRRRAGDGWLEEGGKELEEEVVEIEEDERGENAKENRREDMREEDEDSDEVREVEQEDGKAGEMQVQRSATEWKGAEKNDEERSGAALCAVDGGLQEATQDEWAGKNHGEGEGKEAALEAAARELERWFDKRDFASMAVIGQFNLGFIIGRLGSDLFIVDQHASDEKFNFERLMRSTVLNRQRLLM